MPKFLVLFLVPPDVIENWKKTDPEIRKPAEEKMRADWGAWMQQHGSAITGTEAGGKTKRVSTDGLADTKNDIMLYAFAEAASHDDAAEMFDTHPHLTIPQASIEIMEVRPMGQG